MGHANFLFFMRLALVAALFAALPGCNSSKQELAVEKPIIAAKTSPSPAAAATPMPKLPPPAQAEVEAAFHRVFGDDLVADFSDPQSFIAGDFNGDQSEDIAIIARPARGKLGDINNELANWIIQDADKAFIPPPSATGKVTPPAQKRPQIQANEEVLAIIHGFGPKGWRNADARQAYLVKHAAATFVGTAPSISQKAIRAMRLPVETEIIQEVRNNKKGFVFWTGGLYAWHPEQLVVGN
jgi:hypothetical protein